jgi:hypothetical protein
MSGSAKHLWRVAVAFMRRYLVASRHHYVRRGGPLQIQNDLAHIPKPGLMFDINKIGLNNFLYLQRSGVIQKFALKIYRVFR